MEGFSFAIQYADVSPTHLSKQSLQYRTDLVLPLKANFYPSSELNLILYAEPQNTHRIISPDYTALSHPL